MMTSHAHNHVFVFLIPIISLVYSNLSLASSFGDQDFEGLPDAPFSEIPLPPEHLRGDDPLPPHHKELGMTEGLHSAGPKNYYVASKNEAPKDPFATDSLLASIALGVRQSGGSVAYIMPQKEFYSFAPTFDFDSRTTEGIVYNQFGPGLMGELHYNFRNLIVPFAAAGIAFHHWRAAALDGQPEQDSGGTMVGIGQYGVRFVLTRTFSLIFRDKSETYPPHCRPEEVAASLNLSSSLRDQQVLFAFNLVSG